MNNTITVAVISYNSSKTIVETLESILQTTHYYDAVELIVADDGSTDSTVEIARSWLSENQLFFTRVELVSDGLNRGTAANNNRALASARGAWIKFIAADDILLPESLAIFYQFMHQHPDAQWIFGKSKWYRDEFVEDNRIISAEQQYYGHYFRNTVRGDASKQLNEMKKHNFFVGPGHFFKVNFLQSLGGFDEEFGILEDYPMWIKLFNSGVTAYFLDDFVGGYRLGTTNVCANQSRLFNLKLETLKYQVKKKYYPSVFTKKDMTGAWIHIEISKFFQRMGLNRKSRTVGLIYQWLNRMVDWIL